MAVIQNLYQIFKIPASFLVANNCIVNDYNISRGLKDNNVVSIGDNLVFQQIRYLHKDYRNHKDIYNYIQKLRNNVHQYKKNGEYKKAHILNRVIINNLFVKDIINIYIDNKKSDFHKFRSKGFTFNGVHYTYLCSGSGQIRRNTATFVNSDLYPSLIKILNCGLDEKTSEMSLGKYSAYFALSFSSILWVRTPRVCIISDFFRTIKNQNVDFICKDENGKSYIEKRKLDIELNCADGQGLIDPEFAELWSRDLDLGFTPCSFVVRSAFIKGNLVPFDFKEYAHLNGITQIRDKWGKKYNIDDIDVLLSESQFKTSKYYHGWDDYLSYSTKYNIHWGVARYNKKFDDEFVLSNYQYIQSLDLSQEDIHNLIQPTIEWINKICSGDKLYSLLYMFGAKNPDAEYQTIYGSAQTNTTKAVVKNIDFLKDTYIQRKIYKNITETINHAKIGKIWIKGNYQFCISDPLAQCQSALGLEPKGIIPADYVYSNWWRARGCSNKTIDVCRSPMIDQHEHNPSTVFESEDANYWFKYISSGIIFSTYDTATARMEDSDFDGDIVLTTDNPYFIKGAHKDHNIITYEKGKYSPEKITISNVTRAVLKGFGTGVGGFSNTATCLYAMAAIFNKPEQKDQREEIMYRIKLLREIVGQEIDRIKGADKPSLPPEWKKFQNIEPTDTEQERAEKYKYNSMVVSKKPYFFRYLYPELNQRFKQFEASYNQVSRDMFGIKFKKLMKKEIKTDEELTLIRKYQKYSPLITSNCTMNILCREIESVDFDIRFAKDENDKKNPVVSMLPTYEDKYKDAFDDSKYAFVKNLYKTFTVRKSMKQINQILNNIPGVTDLDDCKEIHTSILNSIIEDIQVSFQESGLSAEEFLFYCNRLSKGYSNFNWGFVWDILEDKIVSIIPYGISLCPVDDKNGQEYLGKFYSLKDISSTSPRFSFSQEEEQEQELEQEEIIDEFIENNC